MVEIEQYKENLIAKLSAGEQIFPDKALGSSGHSLISLLIQEYVHDRGELLDSSLFRMIISSGQGINLAVYLLAARKELIVEIESKNIELTHEVKLLLAELIEGEFLFDAEIKQLFDLEMIERLGETEVEELLEKKLIINNLLLLLKVTHLLKS